MTRRLVVNADDFGLTPGVCRGILRGFRDGVVTSTSVLTLAPGFADHAASLSASGLPAGLHLALVGEDPPLLSRREIPTLVVANGGFPPTWRDFLRRAMVGAIDPSDITQESEAQLALLRDAGIRPTHLDAHQNLHLWPTVGEEVCELARRHEIRVVRVPGGRRVGLVTTGVRLLARALRWRIRAAGLRAPDRAAGFDDAGHMDGDRIRRSIDHMARHGDCLDLTVHPGEDHDPMRDRYDWGYTWPDELGALCDPSLRTWISRRGLELSSFDDVGGEQR